MTGILHKVLLWLSVSWEMIMLGKHTYRHMCVFLNAVPNGLE